MKSFYKIILLAALIFILSACAKRPVKEDASWKNEIAEGHSCGEEGFACCADREPKCFYGLACCNDPNNIENTVCAKDCGCGKERAFCCEGSKCGDGMACVKNFCRKCGGPGEDCCTDSTGPLQADSTPSTSMGQDSLQAGGICTEGFACKSGLCVKCGMAGNPCCISIPFCAGEKKQNGERAECREGNCVLCGANGAAACASEPACNPSNLLNSGFCLTCGGFNQACCELSAEQDQKCDISKGLSCNLGFCSPATSSAVIE